MTILITGATGLIGRALIERLRAQHTLVCQSRNPPAETGGLEWLRHDFDRDSFSALQGRRIDVVFHLAGQTSTYQARNDPKADLRANTLGFLDLLEQLKSQAQPPFIVLASTATTVGLAAELPIHEGMRERPVTFYDISKFAAELYLGQFVREGWVRGCTLRLANVFGRPKRAQADRGIIDKVFQQAAAGRDVSVYGDGAFLRDYVFIDDVVEAFVAAADHPETTNGRTFCIGSGRGHTLKEAFSKVIGIAEQCTGRRVALHSVEPPAGLSVIETRNAIIDTAAFRVATGWVPRYDLDSGLAAAYGASAAARG